MSSKRFHVLSAAALAAVAGAAAIPALTTGQEPTPGKDIVVREKVLDLRFVHQSRATKGDRMRMGDRVLTRQRLFDDSNKPIGRLFTDCVNVGGSARVFDATLLCTASYRFAKGQFATVGAIRLGAGIGNSPTPIVGSGIYRGLHGEVASAPPVKGYESADVLRLDR
jgi:hypothetical protein